MGPAAGDRGPGRARLGSILMTAPQGRLLAGRYRLVERIGAGGMGEVWRAQDTVLGRPVAIKTLDLTRSTEAGAPERFAREARTTASLNHPNVVTVHDSGVDGDTTFLVMELLPGPSVADLLADGPLPAGAVEGIAREVIGGLAAAHAQGLVHRDIKPGNVVRASDGRWRVVDFGISRLADGVEAPTQVGLTGTHVVVGTADYLAPEQALAGRIDARTDLYALGCLLWTLLVGHPPLRGTTPVATMLRHAHEDVPDVRQERPDTPPALARLVTALTRRDPEQRPASAGAALALLDATGIAGGPSQTGALPAPVTRVLPATGATDILPAAPPVPPPAGRPGRELAEERPRRTRWGPLLATLLLVVAALLAWNGWNGRQETPAPEPGSAASPGPSDGHPTTPPTESSGPSPAPAPSTPTTIPEASAPAGGSAAVSAALEALGTAVSSANRLKTIDKDVAKDVQAMVRDLSKAVREDKADTAADLAADLRAMWDEAVADDKVPAATSALIDPLISALDRAVRAWTG